MLSILEQMKWLLGEFGHLLTSNLWSPILGTIGGALGLAAFLEAKLKRFSAKVSIDGNLHIILTKEKSQNGSYSIQSILAKVSFNNLGSKYGVLEDLAANVYFSRGLNPDQAQYFVSAISDTEPDNFVNFQGTPFSPAMLQPQSVQTKWFSFQDLISRSSKWIDINDIEHSYVIDLYAKFSNSKQWKSVKRLHLFKKRVSSQDADGNLISYAFETFDYRATRDKLKPALLKPNVIVYEGVFDHWKVGALQRIKAFLFWRPSAFIKGSSDFRVGKNSGFSAGRA